MTVFETYPSFRIPCVTRIDNLRLDWVSARRHCNSLGGDLATGALVSKAEMWLFNSLGIRRKGHRSTAWLGFYKKSWPFWVGGKKDAEGAWMYHDGEEVTDKDHL